MKQRFLTEEQIKNMVKPPVASSRTGGMIPRSSNKSAVCVICKQEKAREVFACFTCTHVCGACLQELSQK